MSRAVRVFILVSVTSVSGACSQSPTGPTPTAKAPKQAPLNASADGTCDWINPWSKC